MGVEADSKMRSLDWVQVSPTEVEDGRKRLG